VVASKSRSMPKLEEQAFHGIWKEVALASGE
jgi:hypothetical protein